MEGLAPPLKCLIEMQAALQNGETVRVGLSRYANSVPANDEFAGDLRRFLFAWEQGRDWRAVVSGVKSAHRRALLDLVAVSLSGQPVLAHVEELKAEIAVAVDIEIKEHIELLPIKMLVPLLLLQFPAFLVLLFGPLLRNLLEELSR